MILTEIQSNLLTILQGIELLAKVKDDCLLVDDGLENEAMEARLQDKGIAILILDPQATLVDDSTRGAVKLAYSTTIWIRTNPKVKTDDVPNWDPLACESAILTAVMQWSKDRNDFGFVIPPGLEPETDWADIGCHSRLIRFATGVHFN